MKALLPTVWPVPNVSYNTVNLTTVIRCNNAESDNVILVSLVES